MKTLKITLLLVAVAFFGQVAVAQVLITNETTPTAANANALLELSSTTKALLLPRLVNSASVGIGMTSPVNGLLFVGESSIGSLEGLYLYHKLTGAGTGAWHKIMVAGESSLGYLRDVKTGGLAGAGHTSYYIGDGAGFTTPSNKFGNTMVGYNAGDDAQGGFNTVMGYNSGTDLEGGNQNVVLGAQSGLNLTTGNDNVFIGFNSGTSNGDTDASTALGLDATTAGDASTALGYNASAKYTASTAVGTGATTGAANQVVLGTATETVYVPGTFNAQGAVRKNFIAYGASNSYIVSDTDYTILAQVTSGNIAVELPDPANHPGRILVIKHDGNSSGTTIVITVANGASNIDGQPTLTLNSAWAHVTLQSTGVTWLVIGGN